MITSSFKVCAASVAGTILLVFGFSSLGTADDVLNSKTQVANDAQPKTVFELYCGNCSRSMSYHATYADFDEARRAAGVASERFARTDIMSTDLPNGFKSRYSAKYSVSYRLYALGCKSAWLHGVYDSYQTAYDTQKVLSEKGDISYQIVWHYSPLKEAVAKN